MTEDIKFEKAIERLEKIVEELESGNVSLEDALKKYEEGVKLSRTCQQKLSQAEKKIEILTRSLNGTLKKEPFEFEEGDDPAGTGEAPK
ncbi:MAG: exodeoxyribonuclease VII small subunit, partial [Candidatus Omnitrophica bacterium]|nr:exodeoxyribonuclease VII small subunit [Candidatus Omnitrophota bacterium]